uniref:LigA n=1 Tax=Parastrongyloides trichosuri TaxID=131310 RepID=A0A0N4ZIR1_PARTI
MTSIDDLEPPGRLRRLQPGQFGLQRRPVVGGVNGAPQGLDLVDQQLFGFGRGEHRMLQPLGPVGLMLHQGEAEGVEGLALIGLAAHPAQRPRRRAEPAEPVEEDRLPAQGLLLLARQRQRRVQQPLIRRLAQALNPQPVQEGRPQMADIGRAETVQRRRQGLRLGDQFQTPRQLGQVPEHRLRLAREGVEAVLVEIGGGEARLIVRQEAPRAIVEALAGDVQIVGVQHPVHEAGRDPFRRQRRRGLDHRPQKARRVARRDRRMIQAARVLHQRLDLVLAPIVCGALEGPEADMAVRQPHHDGRARRRRLVVPLQILARLDQRQDAAGRNAKALQHGRRQRLAHPALKRQPPVRMARPCARAPSAPRSGPCAHTARPHGATMASGPSLWSPGREGGDFGFPYRLPRGGRLLEGVWRPCRLEGLLSSAPPESRARRRCRDCTRGTGGRGSAWPRGRAGRAGARNGRNGRPIRRRSASPAPPSPPPGRCAGARSSAGSRPTSRRRRSRRPVQKSGVRGDRRGRRAWGADAPSPRISQPRGRSGAAGLNLTARSVFSPAEIRPRATSPRGQAGAALRANPVWQRSRRPDRASAAGGDGVRLDQGRPDGGLLPDRRSGDQIRNSQGRTQQSQEAGPAHPGGSGRHGGSGSGLSGRGRNAGRTASGLAHSAGHRHRLRPGRLRRRGAQPARVAARLPADPGHRRRPGRHRPDRHPVQSGRSVGSAAGGAGRHRRLRRAGPPPDGRRLLGAGLRRRLVSDGAVGPVHVADGRGLRPDRAGRSAPRDVAEPAEGRHARPAPLCGLSGPAAVRLRQGGRLLRRPVAGAGFRPPRHRHRAWSLRRQAGRRLRRGLAGGQAGAGRQAVGRGLDADLRRQPAVRHRLHHEPVHRRAGLPRRRGLRRADRGQAGRHRRLADVRSGCGRDSVVGRRSAEEKTPFEISRFG